MKYKIDIGPELDALLYAWLRDRNHTDDMPAVINEARDNLLDALDDWIPGLLDDCEAKPRQRTNK